MKHYNHSAKAASDPVKVILKMNAASKLVRRKLEEKRI